MTSEYLQVALIGKTVGLKGGLKLHNKSDFPSQFKKGATFILQSGDKISIKSYDQSRQLVVFVGFEDLNLAQNLTNQTLYTTIEETRKQCKLGKDEFFYFDIIGMDVVEDGVKLGIIEDIFDIAASNMFYIKTDSKLVDDGMVEHFYLPYIDKFISSIDITSRTIFACGATLILQNS